MNRTVINTIIQNMKKAGIVTKASEWSIEGFGEKELAVKYVGVKLDESWAEIFSLKNNLLLIFYLDKNTARADLMLANKPPFLKVVSVPITASTKWELVFGELKRQLKKDKLDVQHHVAKIDNLYLKIQKLLK